MPRQQIVFLVWQEWTLLCKWLNHIRWQRTAHWWPWCEPIQWLIEEGRCFTKGNTSVQNTLVDSFCCSKTDLQHVWKLTTDICMYILPSVSRLLWEEVNTLSELAMIGSLHSVFLAWRIPVKKTSDGSTAAVTSVNAWQLQSSICMMGEKGPTA